MQKQEKQANIPLFSGLFTSEACAILSIVSRRAARFGQPIVQAVTIAQHPA
jgi:hypothetical protein